MRYKKSVFRSLAMVSQLGFSVIVPIFLCTFAGWSIDKHFGTKIMVLFLIIGTMAGGMSAYKLAKKTLDAEVKDDERAFDDKLRRAYAAKSANKPKIPSRIINTKIEDKNTAEGGDRCQKKPKY